MIKKENFRTKIFAKILYTRITIKITIIKKIQSDIESN